MKMALKDGKILIKEPSSTEFAIIKSWSKMKWSRSDQMLVGIADSELLNKLAGIVRLPANIEAERQKMNKVIQAVDEERMREHPVPLYKYPVKLPLFLHQIRGANMALLTFGVIKPEEKQEECETCSRYINNKCSHGVTGHVTEFCPYYKE